MSSITISPNMGLTVPTVGVEIGPAWASDLNASLGVLDGHNHTPGNGVAITPMGLNISSDLSIQGNNVTLLRSVRFNPQASALALPADIGCLYEVGVDLFYNDGGGTPIRITQSGAVAGSPGSISNLVAPASASYNIVSSTFVFQSGTLTSANIDGASYVLRNLVASSFGLTLSPPASMAANYTITLPTLPASTLPVQMDVTGVLSTGQITTAQIANQAVTASQIANNTITRAQEAAVGQQISSSSGSFATSSATLSAVTNLSVGITTSGRPVMLMIQDDGSTNESFIGLVSGANTSVSADYALFRGTTQLTLMIIENNNASQTFVPPSSLIFLDTPSAGSYTYTLKAACSNGSSNAFVRNSVLVAYEL